MLRKLLITAALITCVGCNHQDEPKQPIDSAASDVPVANVASENVYTVSLTFKAVRYIAAGRPHVEVVDANDSVYYDYGSSKGSALYWFNRFYAPAFNNTGLMTYQFIDGQRVLGRGCSACTSIESTSDSN